MFFYKNSISLIEFILLLIVPIPVLLTTGPFLPDLFLTLSVMLFIYYLFREKKTNIFIKNKFFVFFFSFWIILLISSFLGNSENYLWSFKSSLAYIRFGIFVILLIFISNYFKNFKIYLINSCIIALSICIISGLYQILTVRIDYLIEVYNLFKNTGAENFKDHFGSIGPTHLNRITLPFSEWMVTGSLIMRLFPIAIMIILITKKISKKNKILINLFFILSLITVLLSGERASIILFIFQIIIFFILSKRLRNFLKLSLVFCVIIGSIFVYFDPISKGRLITQTLDNIKGTSSVVKKKYIISEIHEKHFVGAWKIFLDNKLFGAGLKGYRYECYNNEKYNNDEDIICSSHPHNTLMQFISELGIVGILFYITIFSYVLRNLVIFFIKIYFKKDEPTRYDEIKMLAYLSLFITLWPLTTSGSFFNNWLSIIYYLPLFLILKDHKDFSDGKNN